MKCNSLSDLYLVTSPSHFVGLAFSPWHRRLGRPSSSILQSLHKTKFISNEQLITKTICNSCVFGKHVKVLFNLSKNFTLMPFDNFTQ